MPACFPVARRLQTHVGFQYELKLFFGDARPVVPEIDIQPLPAFGVPFVLFLGTLSALVLARGAMFGILWPEVAGNPASDILNALYIGTKFDIRMVVLGLIPIALILGIPPLERLLARSRGFRGLIVLLYAVVFAAATLVYIIDFGWFFYLHTRVDASLFELLGDPEIAGTMVWESYPVVWITFGLIAATALYALFFGKTLARHEATPRPVPDTLVCT